MEDKEDTFTALTWPIYATELVGEGKHLVVEEKWQLQKAPEISHIYIWVIDCVRVCQMCTRLYLTYIKPQACSQSTHANITLPQLFIWQQ